MPGGWDRGRHLINNACVVAKGQRKGKGETLREADRRSTLLLFLLLSNWCLEFESPQMWHGLTFGIWVTATGERTGEIAQTEMSRNVEKAFLIQSH